MSEIELEPCPFCGFEAELICVNTNLDSSMAVDDPYREDWNVQCPDCGATQESDLVDRARAIADWNTRTAVNSHKALKEALESLANEASGFRMAEPEIRQIVGNTNWNCLMLRVEQAREALELSNNPKGEE